jgi:site-specific recombinase XerD
MNQLEFVVFDEVTKGFLEYSSKVRRLAPRSVVDMRCTFRQVLSIMAKIRPGIELWRLSFDDYLAWVEQVRRLDKATASIAKQISQLKSLIDYAWRSGRTERNVLDGFKLKDLGTIVSIPPEVLTVDEARRLIAACPKKSPAQKRDRMMILLLYGCGLRTGELCKLGAKSVDLERQELFIKDAKGDIQRRVPIPDTVWTELLAYLAEKKARKGPLFATEAKKTRIRDKDVLMAVHAASKRAGLSEDVVPKTLRHSYATHLMDAGVDLALIASLMGHRSPSESGVYLHSLPGAREAAVEKLSLRIVNTGLITKNENEKESTK